MRDAVCKLRAARVLDVPVIREPTLIHISLVTAIGAFFVSALSLFLGFFLILHGTTGEVALQIEYQTVKVNFYSLVPGVAFGLFGAAISWRALSVLIRRG